jgi:hypothetical protein
VNRRDVRRLVRQRALLDGVTLLDSEGRKVAQHTLAQRALLRDHHTNGHGEVAAGSEVEAVKTADVDAARGDRRARPAANDNRGDQRRL